MANAPLHIVTDFLYATPLYFVSGYAQSADRWAFFAFVIMLQDLVSNALYRSFTYAASTDEVAMVFSAIAVAVALSLGNFFVVATSVGWWLRWFVYASPFYWTETAIVNNEFSDSKYAVAYPDGSGRSYGDVYMASYDFPFSLQAKWGGVGVLLAWVVVGLALQVLALRFVRFPGALGTRRRNGIVAEAVDEAEDKIIKVSNAVFGDALRLECAAARVLAAPHGALKSHSRPAPPLHLPALATPAGLHQQPRRGDGGGRGGAQGGRGGAGAGG